MDRLVGILRSENALTARLVRQNCVVDFQESAAVAQAFSENTGWYEFADCPLPLLTPGFPQQAALLEAWEALAHATAPDLDAVSLVLAQTVLGQPIQHTLLLPVAQTQPAIKPTAAHPRAYAGTKYQPPTPKAAAARDWRPVLCHPHRLGALAPNAADEARLPQPFRTSLYPLVRHQSEAEIAETLALYWAMSLDSNPERLAAVSYLFCLHSDKCTRDWCRLLMNQLPEHWTDLLHLLVASGADTADAGNLPASFGAMMAEVLAGKDPFYRAYWLLHSLALEIDPAYLLTGYRLADTLEQSYAFHDVRRSGYFPMQTVLRWGEHCRTDSDFYAGLLLRLWEQCGLRPGLGEYLEKADWTRLTPAAAWRVLKLLRGSWDNWGDLPEAEADAKWAAARPLVGAMLTLVQETPSEYQDKCAWHLIEYLWQWDAPKKLQAHLPSALALTRRLCHPPFAVNNDPTEAATDFLAELPPAQRERFLQAPDASFKRLEQACRRDNDARLIGRGTWALTRHQAEFSLQCFESDPVRLFHAAKLLGTLPAPMRDAVVRAFVPLSDETPRDALARLEEAATAALAQGFSLEARGQSEKHALQMQQVIQENRRALRKFLAAHWEGRTDYRQAHPLTQRWLAAHPSLPLAIWQAGVVLDAGTAAGSAVTLAVEQDPLEALKLGTYVGSCLGLGGSFAYSAAAVVLDINKQVVYARDTRGAVVGRQLVAISEDERLVCYEVYPLNAQKELNNAFREFDRQFASALGLPIYNCDETEDYKIAHVLSHDWWDDSAWNLAAADEKE